MARIDSDGTTQHGSWYACMWLMAEAIDKTEDAERIAASESLSGRSQPVQSSETEIDRLTTTGTRS
jgi:hypothetical protein